MDRTGSIRAEQAPVSARAVMARLCNPVMIVGLATQLGAVWFGWWTLNHLVPDTLALSAFGHTHIFTEVHRRLVDRAVQVSLLVPAVFLAEYLWMGWEFSSIRHFLHDRSASSRSDLACYLFCLAPVSTIVSGIMSFGMIYISGGWLRHALGQASGMHLNIRGAPLAIQVGAVFILYSFLDYWSHRLEHSRLLWPLHRFHHSAESFSVLTASRIHPAAFTAALTTALPSLLLGSTRGALADVGIAAAIIRLVIHSRIESDFGWFGRWVVQSPLHHRLHHSFSRMPFNSGLLPIWDRLFGTWREVPTTPMKLGTVTPYRQGLWIGPDIWRDYREFWSGLRKTTSRSVMNILHADVRTPRRAVL